MVTDCASTAYTIIDDSLRNYLNPMNLSHFNNDYNLAPGWYRMKLNGVNAKLATTCVENYFCGMNYSIWWTGTTLSGI